MIETFGFVKNAIKIATFYLQGWGSNKKQPHCRMRNPKGCQRCSKRQKSRTSWPPQKVYSTTPGCAPHLYSNEFAPCFHNMSKQWTTRLFATHLFNTCLQHMFTTHVYNTSLQHLKNTLRHFFATRQCNTSLKHFVWTCLKHVFTQHFFTTHLLNIFSTRPSNTSSQHVFTTHFYKTIWQHVLQWILTTRRSNTSLIVFAIRLLITSLQHVLPTLFRIHLFKTSLQHILKTHLFNTSLQHDFPTRLGNTTFISNKWQPRLANEHFPGDFRKKWSNPNSPNAKTTKYITVTKSCTCVWKATFKHCDWATPRMVANGCGRQACVQQIHLQPSENGLLKGHRAHGNTPLPRDSEYEKDLWKGGSNTEN